MFVVLGSVLTDLPLRVHCSHQFFFRALLQILTEVLIVGQKLIIQQALIIKKVCMEATILKGNRLCWFEPKSLFVLALNHDCVRIRFDLMQ